MTNNHRCRDTDALPGWITRELSVETLDVWRPYFKEPLTDRDVIEILLTVRSLLDVLGDTDDEAVPGVGEGLES